MASWGGFFNGLAKVLTNIALFTASHPEIVQGAVTDYRVIKGK